MLSRHLIHTELKEKTLAIQSSVDSSRSLDFIRWLKNTDGRAYKIGHYRYLLLDNGRVAIFNSIGDRWKATSIVSIGSTRSVDGMPGKTQELEQILANTDKRIESATHLRSAWSALFPNGF